MSGYEESGYEVAKQAIPLPDLEPFIGCIEQAVDSCVQMLFEDGEISDCCTSADFAHRFALICSESSQPDSKLQKLKDMRQFCQRLQDDPESIPHGHRTTYGGPLEKLMDPFK